MRSSIFNGQALAIIKKDIAAIVSNRRMFLTLLIVPLVLTVIVPTVFLLILHFVPEETADFQKLLELMPIESQPREMPKTLINLLLNYFLPIFFLIIPVMAASVMAASSFVGEKEKRTLETLLYGPLSLKEIFYAKVMASFLLSMAVSVLSFAAMLLVLEIESGLLLGFLAAPKVTWLLIMLLVSPAISLIAVTLIVRFSAKAQSIEDAQQSAIFLLLPILLLLVGQFTGVLLLSGWLLLALGLVCAAAAALLLKRSLHRFQYETLLQ